MKKSLICLTLEEVELIWIILRLKRCRQVRRVFIDRMEVKIIFMGINDLILEEVKGQSLTKVKDQEDKSSIIIILMKR